MEILKKENLLIAVAIACVVIYFNQKIIKENKSAQKFVSALPVIGGLALGFNTLINLTK